MPVSVKEKSGDIRTSIGKVIIGKQKEIDLILTALLSEGHVLMEDVPGTGKTLLAKALAKSLALNFGRIQFTPDLLPSDLTGINFYNQKTGEFVFRKGSLFANILLADEINRATPRTQSGLLEAMEEKQITVDGETIPLKPPYFVIATQNPIETQGTYPLPEAQLDRFLIRLSLGYPETEESIEMLTHFMRSNPLEEVTPVCTAEELQEMQRAVKEIFIHADVLRYIVELAEATRRNDKIRLGVSARGSLGLMRVSQAYAAINGRGFVTPDDVQVLAPYVFSHRLITGTGFRTGVIQPEDLIREIISSVTAPTENWERLY